MENEKKLSVTLEVTARDLWRFSMHHSNSGMLGIFNLIFTAAALFLLVVRWGGLPVSQRLLLVFCASIFTVWQPLMLYRRACRQAKAPHMNQPMDLTFSEEGLLVEQNGQSASFEWGQMARVDKLPSMVIIYMDRVHAYLLPNETLGQQQEAFLEMVRTHVPKTRRRRI